MSHWPWEQLEAFAATLEHGSLSGASRSLGLAQPTVRRRVEALEAALGQPLFVRSANGLVPTETAESVAPVARAMQSHARALVRAGSARPEATAGVVRVTVPAILGVHVLPPRLAGLRAQAPDLHLEWVTSDAVDDLLRRDADLAVRTVAPSQSALVARRIGTIAIGLAASPDYLARHGDPTVLDELVQHALITDDRRGQLLMVLGQWGLDVADVSAVLRSDDTLAQLAAVRAGLGVGVCQVPLMDELGLVRVLPALEVLLPVWVVVHEDLRRLTRVRRVFDYLVETLTAYLGPSAREG